VSEEAAHGHIVEGHCKPNEDTDTITGLARKTPMVETQEYGRRQEEGQQQMGTLSVKNQKTPIIR
jgi:hypothetical protein